MTTLQEIFDRICEHAVTQSSRSEDDEGGCLYRHPDGRRCFVGVLISDEAYSPELEDRSVGHVEICRALERSGVPISSNRELSSALDGLQGIHDFNDPEDWPAELRLFGEMNGLSIPECIQEHPHP